MVSSIRMCSVLILLLSVIAISHADFRSMKVTELKELLKSKGLPLVGIKAELIARLESYESSSTTVSSITADDLVSAPVRPKGGSIMRNRLLKKAAALSRESLEDLTNTPIMDKADSMANDASRIVTKKHSNMVEDTVKAELSSIAKNVVKSSVSEMDELELLMIDGEDFISSKNVELPRRDIGALREKALETPTKQDDVYQKILALVNERLRLRSIKDYDAADEIRLNLKDEYGVEMIDKLGEWMDSDGRYGRYSSLVKGPAVSNITTTITKDQIQRMVEQRTLLRRSRKYEEADVVRNKLAENGVEVFDKLNEWATLDGKYKGLQSYDMR